MISLFKGKFKISPFVPMLLAIISFSPDVLLFYTALIAAAFHETAHIAAMKLFGARVLRIAIYPFGADICADTSRLSYKSEVTVFLSGPLASFLLSVFSLLFYASVGGVYVLAFCISNFLFFIINIFPVKGLDGGRTLHCVLCNSFELRRAEQIYDIVTTISFGVLCLLAVILLMLSGYNLSLAFICCYLFISEYVKEKCVEEKPFNV